MRITIEVVRLGGGYKKAIIGHSLNSFTGEWCVDSVFGADEEELLQRLKIRIPQLNRLVDQKKLFGGRR